MNIIEFSDFSETLHVQNPKMLWLSEVLPIWQQINYQWYIFIANSG